MRVPHESSVGQLDFIETHGLWSDEQRAAAEELTSRLRDDPDIKRVRISWCDQHGIARGKTLTTPDFLLALRNGQDFQTATLIMDTTNSIAVPLFSKEGSFGVEELAGYPDGLLIPDPTTFRTLPWSPGTGWVLSEMFLQSGRPVPFCSRQLLKTTLGRLHERGYDYMAGLEVEFYITKLEDRRLTPAESGWPPEPPAVSTVAHGFQYLTEVRNDEIDDILVLLQDSLTDLDLPLRSMEDEWGPGQCEFTFDPQTGLSPADSMLLFRTAVKQVCRRHGLHATFMTKPALPNFFSSGWHLHESLIGLEDGKNAFVNNGDDAFPLSETGRYFLGGLLEHAVAGSVFATPTVNGYKRFAPMSFAPDRASWAVENRGAFVRLVGGPKDPSTHLENRAGEPCANPYLYMAAQIVAGLDGLDRKLDPGPPDDEPYAADRPLLPVSLDRAIDALETDGGVFRKAFGDPFVDFITTIKRHEVGRYQSHVSDWEHREYFELY
jgi:glutamine synthetase